MLKPLKSDSKNKNSKKVKITVYRLFLFTYQQSDEVKHQGRPSRVELAIIDLKMETKILGINHQNFF